MATTPANDLEQPISKQDKKVCFVIAPIGSEDSATRRATDGMLDSALNPVLNDRYDVEVAHRISQTGSITQQVLKRVLQADLVVAVISELNPNVMYELGIRHAAAKPVVVLAESGTKLPFDVATERTIFYEPDPMGMLELSKELSQALKHIRSGQEEDNPVTRANKGIAALASTGPQDPTTHIIERLDRLEVQIARSWFDLKNPNRSADISRPPTGPMQIKGSKSQIVSFLYEIDEFETAMALSEKDEPDGEISISIMPNDTPYTPERVQEVASSMGLTVNWYY